MARKKVSTTVYITPEQDERLKLLHRHTRVPVAEYIREAIDMLLEKHGTLLKEAEKRDVPSTPGGTNGQGQADGEGSPVSSSTGSGNLGNLS